MIITCEAALLFESVSFFRAVILGSPISAGKVAEIPWLASTLNVIFGIIGIILFILGLVVAYDAAKAYGRARRGE